MKEELTRRLWYIHLCNHIVCCCSFTFSGEGAPATFRGLSCLMRLFLIIPVNTAMCERGFSCMKRIKSDWRCSLSTPSLSRLMYLSIQGSAPDDFDACGAVHRWWGSGQRTRRPGFSPWASHDLTQVELEKELEEELAKINEGLNRMQSVNKAAKLL